MDIKKLMKRMKMEQIKKQKSEQDQPNSKKQQAESKKQNQQQQRNQQQDDYFNSTMNSFLIAEKSPTQIQALDLTHRQEVNHNYQTTSQSFFRKTTDAFKQSQRQYQQPKPASMSTTLSHFNKTNLFNPYSTSASHNKESHLKKNLSERFNNTSVGGDFYSPLAPSTVGVFKPFRDMIQNQHKSVMDLFNDNRIQRQDKIKQQLHHNSAQMTIIKQQNDSERINSFENVLNMKQYTDNLISKSGVAKKIQIQNYPVAKGSLSTNNGNAGQQIQLQPLVSHSISAINQNSNLDIEDPNNEQQQQNKPADLFFHWEKIVNYANELKPEFREGATLVEYKQNFFLYGGFGYELMNSIFQFRLRDYKWRKIETDGDSVPHVGRFGHTANIYKNQMIIFGGGGDYNHKLKNRLVLNEMWILNLENLQWKQMRTKGDYVEPRRHHAACIVGNNYFVYGGVESHEHYISSLNVLQLEKGRWQTWNFKLDESGVAFHQMVPIFKKYLKICSSKQSKMVILQNQKNQLKVKEEGIYCFGGKQGNEKIRGKLMILKCDQKEMPVEWIIPETLGQNPPARFQHSLLYNWQVKGLVLFGGRNDEANLSEHVFQDIWVLYLANLMWVSVNVSGQQNRYRFAHAFATIDERMFVFGGASNLSYTDCELYVLEMDKLYAMKKRNNPVRDIITRQASIERLEDEEIEAVYQERIKVAQRRLSGVKTFLRPPTKNQLKTQQEELLTIPLERGFRKSTFYSQESSPRSNGFSPRLRQDSILFKPKQQSLFSQQTNV